MAKPDTVEMFKADYDGDRPKGAVTAPERQKLRLVKAAVVDRLHTAMLTLSVMQRAGPAGIICASVPPHLVEFSDRVGEEVMELARAKFEPSAADVTDMPKALALLDGLRKPYYDVVRLRALEIFARDAGETGPWPWDRIGEKYRMSANWAQDIYDAAIIQAARRAGVLPMVSNDYGIVVAATWVDKGWLTNLSTASDPRQAIANLRIKSPVRLEQAIVVWVAGAPLGKRIIDAVKPKYRGAVSHASWYKVHPDALANEVVEAARKVGADWLIEEVPLRGALAA